MKLTFFLNEWFAWGTQDDGAVSLPSQQSIVHAYVWFISLLNVNYPSGRKDYKLMYFSITIKDNEYKKNGTL